MIQAHGFGLQALALVKKRCRSLAFVFIFLMSFLLPGRLCAGLSLGPEHDFLDVANEYEYYCEPFVDLPIDPWRVVPENLRTEHQPLNLGFLSNEVCWTQIKIEYRGNTSRLVYLEKGSTRDDLLHVFHQSNSDRWSDLGSAGRSVATEFWPVFYRLPTFELSLQPGINIIRIYQSTSDRTIIDWKLWDPKFFRVSADWEIMLLGGFFAICIVLSLYNLVIFAVDPDLSHLYYFFYLSSYACVQMYATGFGKLYIFPDIGALLGNLGAVSISLSLFSVYLFVYKLLEVEKFPTLMRRFFWSCAWLSLSNILLVFLGYYSMASRISLILAGASCVVILGFGAYGLKKKMPMAAFFMVAWSMLALGTMVQVLALSGYIPSSGFTKSANFMGATLESILLSYALAVKMKLKQSKEVKMRKHAFSQLEKMVYPHQLTLMKEGKQLEETMPLANSWGCVICVDMVDSSKQNISELKDFLRLFFDECEEVMNQGYRETGMEAFGFRLKEMGDGFLCSIGFPFAPPADLCIRKLALDLAYSFVQKFEETSRKMPIKGSSEPFLSIGIAEGPIEGFFTLSGIRSYDLFGKGIVLATRYEGLRKIYQMPGEGHLICLRSSIYKVLPAHYQSTFNCYSLENAKRLIRDDDAAQEFYYQRIPSVSKHLRVA